MARGEEIAMKGKSLFESECVYFMLVRLRAHGGCELEGVAKRRIRRCEGMSDRGTRLYPREGAA